MFTSIIKYMLLLFIMMLTSCIKILNNRHNVCYLLLGMDFDFVASLLFCSLLYFHQRSSHISNIWELQPGLLTSSNPPLIEGSVRGGHLMASSLLLQYRWQAFVRVIFSALFKEEQGGSSFHQNLILTILNVLTKLIQFFFSHF